MEKATSIRRERMSLIAQSGENDLADVWTNLGIEPEYKPVRGPETGLIALRGRIGGGGSPFNFGESTVTRATIELENGTVGHAVILGRSHEKARLAALIDALAQDDKMLTQITSTIVVPLRQKLAARDKKRAEETAATRVDFFTLVRGDD